MASIHETAESPHVAGVMDRRTMPPFAQAASRRFALAGAEIRALREREGASQAVFARYLNVTKGLVSQWERGEKHPAGRLAQAAFSSGGERVGSCRLIPSTINGANTSS